MNTIPAFEGASQPIYESARFSAPEDKACISALESLARLLPADPRVHIIPERLHAVGAAMEKLTPTDALGSGFIHAYKAMAETAKELCYLDGNHNHCLRMNVYDVLLDGFQSFHSQQDSLTLSQTGAGYFADRQRARQVYRDMGGGVAPTAYEPSIYR